MAALAAPMLATSASAASRVSAGTASKKETSTRLPERTIAVAGAQVGNERLLLPPAAVGGVPVGHAGAQALPADGVQTASKTEPHWACPEGPCEAIIDPPAIRRSGHYALPAGGPLLEGSGEDGGLDPQDLESAYDIPVSGGSSQTIALIDAYGYEAAEANLAKYRERYGLPACTKADGCFRKVNAHGEEGNYPLPRWREGWITETALDLDMASAACPGCHIMLVEASGETLADLGEAVNTAARLGATEISNSYGGPEQDCAQVDCQAVAGDYDHPGVVITVASGDTGYDDHNELLTNKNGGLEEGDSPNFPATLPYVIAAGGTSLRRASGGRGWSEEVWPETGSGCSVAQIKPTWQTDAGCAHRTDNDTAAVASCETPVSVYSVYGDFEEPYPEEDGEGWLNVCGTSVSSPLVAGIEAHASEAAGLAPTADAFYQHAGSLFDVTAGANGECTPPTEDEYLCHAQAGYDGPTGNGTPDGPVASAGQAPSARGETASDVTETTGTLNGVLDPNGLETSYRFEYGTTTSYGTDIPVPDAPAGSGTAIKTVSEAIGGLSPATVYHYRLLATNSAGTVASEDRTFTTASPTVTGVAPATGPSFGGVPVTITGTNFDAVTAVKFGSTNAASYEVQSESTLLVVAPPGGGTVDVTVTTPAGTSATSAADQFVYYPSQSPLIQPGTEFGEGFQTEENSSIGGSLALSGEGNTALIGQHSGPTILTRTGSTWTVQAKLAADTLPDGSTIPIYGNSSTLSEDGNTVLIGVGEGDEPGMPAALVYTRSGSTWSEQAALYTKNSEQCDGGRVALSADGNTALIGCNKPVASGGRTLVFTRSGANWSEDTELDAGGDGSLALSADGETALIGRSGWVWAYSRSGSTWTQDGPPLTGRGSNGEFGWSMALSATGETALIGGKGEEGSVAWVFTRSGSTWTQQGEALTELGEFSGGGGSVALSADGNLALIGAGNGEGGGDAWMFARSGSTWTQQGPEIIGPYEGEFDPSFGAAAALSAAGNAALIGGPTWHVGTGRAWVYPTNQYSAPPIVTGLTPDNGPVAGGASVTISGLFLSGASAVHFGAAEARSVHVELAN